MHFKKKCFIQNPKHINYPQLSFLAKTGKNNKWIFLLSTLKLPTNKKKEIFQLTEAQFNQISPLKNAVQTNGIIDMVQITDQNVSTSRNNSQR